MEITIKRNRRDKEQRELLINSFIIVFDRDSNIAGVGSALYSQIIDHALSVGYTTLSGGGKVSVATKEVIVSI